MAFGNELGVSGSHDHDGRNAKICNLNPLKIFFTETKNAKITMTLRTWIKS